MILAPQSWFCGMFSFRDVPSSPKLNANDTAPLEDAAAYSPVATFCIQPLPSAVDANGDAPRMANAAP